MPASIELPDDLLALLGENARARGEDLNTYAVAALREAAARDAGVPPLRRGKPLAQYIEEQRAKHSLPADWPDAPRYRMTDEDWKALDEAHTAFLPDQNAAA